MAALLLRIPATGAPATSLPPIDPGRPSFVLGWEGGMGAGRYVDDPGASLATCSTAPDGSWRVLYAGGEPFVNLDLLVGGRAGDAGGAARVAAELYAGPGYVRFDPSALRGGDPPGRSTANVVVSEDADGVTFHVTASTPDGMTGDDRRAVDIDLTVTCPT